MYKLCVFAGTADGRALIRWLAPQAQVLACAATEYGGELLEEIPGVEVSAGRLDREAMEALFRISTAWAVESAHRQFSGIPPSRVSRR